MSIRIFSELFEKLSDFSRKSLAKIGFEDNIAMFIYQLISIQITNQYNNNIISLNDNSKNNQMIKKIKYSAITALTTVIQQLNIRKLSKRKKTQDEFKYANSPFVGIASNCNILFLQSLLNIVKSNNYEELFEEKDNSDIVVSMLDLLVNTSCESH